MRRSLLFFGIISLIWSCEDVIDVETQPEAPRLVVDAVIRVDTTQQFIEARVTVTESSDFFSENQPTQLDENATIFFGEPDPNSLVVEPLGCASLAETAPGTGIYEIDPDVFPCGRLPMELARPGMVFRLLMRHKGRTYYAITPYVSTVPIDDLQLGDQTLFDEDETEVQVTFTDVENQEDFYVFDFGFGEFLAVEDQFFDGQQFEFSYFYDQTFESGQELEISILGADQPFFNYMDLLVEQTLDDGGVFETPVATVRGNVFDITGLDNVDIFDNVERPNDFALGYFAVVQEYKETIVIE
ncbi:DUF4249 family protein [Allomuricauda sp. d1]|uniref:DUF4249 family protein n=1 Tax=Allomuricauda sp. d1 TaxID=3136725 RepID=UPI0031E0278A